MYLRARRSPVCTILAISSLLAILMAEVHAQVSVPDGQPEDRQEVLAFWSTLDAIWNRGDVDGFTELFTSDSDLEFVDRGQSLGGHAAIRQHFERQFATTASDIRHRTTVGDVYEIAPDVLGVDARVEILRVGAEDGPEVASRVFAVFGVMVPGTRGWELRTLKVYMLNPSAG